MKTNMKWIWITHSILLLNIFPINSIQNIPKRGHRPVRFTDQINSSNRHFREIDSSTYGANFDWEHGLREATVQALFREHYGDEDLRKHIHSAPLLGKQDKATPFGDIAILARGQLYANYAGFIFVQDPYQNDCDDCHNINADAARSRCINNHCQIWHPKNNEHLIALWQIKRIRHRSLPNSPKYEMEFTISPVGLRYQKEGYLTKEGTFNYNLPGHVFILKNSETSQYSPNEQHANHLKQGVFIALTPDGRKFILHSFPGLITPETPRFNNLPPKYPVQTSSPSTTEYSEEDEKKIYQTLFEELNKKTSPEANRITPTSKTSTTLSDTTLVQFPDGQIVPITELQTPFITKTTPGYVNVRFPETNVVQTTPEKHITSSVGSTQSETVTSPSSSRVTPQSYGIMRPQTTPQLLGTTIPHFETTQRLTPHGFHATTGQYTTLPEPHSTFNEIPRTNEMVYTKPRPFYTTPSTETYGQTIKLETTKPPVKMTFHFFAAEEEKKTTPEIIKPSFPVQEQTKYENFLPNTLVPTEPTYDFASESTATESKETSRYSPTGSTKPAFTSTSTTTKYKPATVVKVTKPVPVSTKSTSSILTTSYIPSTTEPMTKTIPSIALEPSTSYSIPTKESHSTFRVPITVLEESTDETTHDQGNEYPSTPLGPIVTYSQVPSTTFKEHTVSESGTKYPSTEFNPTTLTIKLTSVEQGTKFQTPVYNTESGKETTFSSTIYTKNPTLDPGIIETTLGETKIMGSAQNKTTEMIYYAAQETEVPSHEVTQSLSQTTFGKTTQSSVGTTQPTYSSLETKTEPSTTPKRIVTTISADGTVSVKTTPISADEELFGVNKYSTKSYKTTRGPKISTTTESSDFLIDDGTLQDVNVPLFKKPLKDYSEDDIFGPTKNSVARTSKITSTMKPYTKSEIEQALFDTNSRKSKALKRRKSSTTESPPNVVYSNYFEASTVPMTTETPETTTMANVFIVTPSVTMETAMVSRLTPPVVRPSFSVAKKQKPNYITTESVPIATTMIEEEAMTYESEKTMPITSQSYLTSISYEVNKRKKLFESKLKERSQNLRAANKYGTKKPENMDKMDEMKENRPIMSISDDDIALRLVSQAKGVEYLEQQGTTGASTLASTSAKTTKKSKYTRRRSYTPRAKRPTRKKVVKIGKIEK